MELGIRGKVALVLGASGGLGGGAARALAAEGVVVVCAGRDRGRLDGIVAEIVHAGGVAHAVQLDLADRSRIDAVVTDIEERIGGIDILVNVSGGPAPSGVAAQPLDTWTEQFNSMVLAIIALTDRVLPGMRERRWGRIITNTSSGPIAPIANLGLSNTLRSSLHGWSKSLANEVAREGVTSNVVVPGRIHTARIDALNARAAEQSGRPLDEVAEAFAQEIPTGRYGTVDEYGAVVAFLASVQASYITGSQIRVDGGLIPSV
ncbi:MAG TPA: SDR family oxidoreductase [Microbacteriaceae bacterium]|nr:SDR family oxidoreductase [Microbacteriaceae bacterium]